MHPSWYSDFLFFASAKCDLSCALCQQRTNSFYDREDEEHFMLALPTETISTFPFRLWRSENCLLAFQLRGGRRLMHLSVSLGNRKTRRGRKCYPFHSLEETRSRLFLVFRVKWVDDTTCWCRRTKVFGLTIFWQTHWRHASFATHPVVEMKRSPSQVVLPD